MPEARVTSAKEMPCEAAGLAFIDGTDCAGRACAGAAIALRKRAATTHALAVNPG